MMGLPRFKSVSLGIMLAAPALMSRRLRDIRNMPDT